jgi:phosphotransferase system  glucose/maltose/N-acetylglucosamine-specific IIC component
MTKYSQEELKKKLSRAEKKKNIILWPALISIVISFFLLFVIPDLIRGDDLFTAFSSNQRTVNSETLYYDLESTNQTITERNNDNEVYAWILLAYIFNVTFFFIAVISSLYFYSNISKRIDKYNYCIKSA